MKSIYLAAAAISGVVLFASVTPASASTCASDCNTTYSACNSANGANGQSICMPKWMQCKKSCSAPVAMKAKAKTPPLNVTPVKLVSATKTTKVTSTTVKMH